LTECTSFPTHSCAFALTFTNRSWKVPNSVISPPLGCGSLWVGQGSRPIPSFQIPEGESGWRKSGEATFLTSWNTLSGCCPALRRDLCPHGCLRHLTALSRKLPAGADQGSPLRRFLIETHTFLSPFLSFSLPLQNKSRTVLPSGSYFAEAAFLPHIWGKNVLI